MEKTLEKRPVRGSSCPAPSTTIAVQEPLHPLPYLRIYDGLVLTGVDRTVVADPPDVQRVGKQLTERVDRELPAPAGIECCLISVSLWDVPQVHAPD